MDKLTITKPDDWHLHLRDGEFLKTTTPDAAKRFGRVIIMPNLNPPVTTAEQAKAYLQRIKSHIPKNNNFTPLMTLYLTDQTTPAMIKQAKDSGIIYGCKLYFAGTTTHAHAGVTNIELIYDALAAMSEYQIPLLIHGEIIDEQIDIFDREKVFIERLLFSLIERFPSLRIVFEHISTEEAVDFVTKNSPLLAATITAHHLLLNRNDIFSGGINPHYYCLPILKTHRDQEALLEAATSGNPKFFLGTDSAPHSRTSKECSCGRAGIYTEHAAIELYAEIFDKLNALHRLEAFASFHGADFYQLPRNQERITLIRKTWQVPETFVFGTEQLVPFRAGEQVHWSIES